MGVFCFPYKTKSPPFTNYFEIKGTTELHRKILKALPFWSKIWISNHAWAITFELLAFPKFMEYNVTSSGRHQKSLCHKNTEKSFIWNYNKEVWQDPALVISPERFIPLTLMRANLKPDLTGSDHQAADHQSRQRLLSHSCMSVADIMNSLFRCWCIIASTSELSKN